MIKKSRAPRRRALNRRAIAQKALQLIDRDGLDALSMRVLGSALGVEAMALYHHFRNKGELLDGVLELLLETLEQPSQGRRQPLARLRKLFEDMRRIAIKHPHAFILLPTRRFRTPAQLRFYEWMLGIFHGAGFDSEASARYFRVLAGFVTGAGLAEIGSRGLQPDATPIILEDFKDEKNFPRVTEIVQYLNVSRLDRIFTFGLDLIFEAMQRELRAGGKS